MRGRPSRPSDRAIGRIALIGRRLVLIGRRIALIGRRIDLIGRPSVAAPVGLVVLAVVLAGALGVVVSAAPEE